MQNKENGAYRPTFYSLRDEKTGLFWMVPLSSRVNKFQAIYDKQVQKYETAPAASCQRKKSCICGYFTFRTAYACRIENKR